MANTLLQQLPVLSQKVYKEWFADTKLVKSCSTEFEGEFDTEKLEIDIPVFGHISIHTSSLKELDVKPAPIEFARGSTIRVIVDKVRYNHWGRKEFDKLINSLTQEDSEYRKKIAKDWALHADEELAVAIGKLPASRHIAITGSSYLNAIVSKSNILQMFDILKAIVKSNHQDYTEFEFFCSEKIDSIIRDAQIDIKSTPAKEALHSGYVGKINGIEVIEHDIDALVIRDTNTKLVKTEHAIWKTRDGIQYVTPYKTTDTYELQKDEVLGGGQGFQMIEMYDFFNLYPTRLYVVDLKYDSTNDACPVYTGANATANLRFGDKTRGAMFGTAK